MLKPALTMMLTIQPAAIWGLASRRELAGLGPLARLLFTSPQSLVGHRDADPPPLPAKVRAACRVRITALHDIPDADHGPGVGPLRHTMVLSADAREALREQLETTEVRLREFEDLGPVAEWGSKLGGARRSGWPGCCTWPVTPGRSIRM